MNTSELDEIIDEFVVESLSDLDELEQAFVSLEQQPDNDALAKIFRTIHTIKGTSGFLGFGSLESLTHVGENLLSKLRDGERDITSEITSTLLTMTDAIRSILGHVGEHRVEPDVPFDALIDDLTRLNDGIDAEPPEAEEAHEAEEADVVRLAERRSVRDSGQVPGTDEAELRKDLRIGQQLLEAGAIDAEQLQSALDLQDQGDTRLLGELLIAQQAVQPKVVGELVNSTEERHQVAESIRVDVGLLDDLMNRVGELVLARNQILQFNESLHDAAFVATTQRLDLITSELQESVMRTRMQPIENVWNKFPRVVRDLTVSIDKVARLEMEGKNTELDKTLLEAIRDPLTHLVRNSIDHGIEETEARVAAGKPPEGVVTLRARHEGGQVVVEISDDGAGIDPERIRRKAVEKGIVTAEEAAERSDRDIVSLIFLPGFSTAAAVTNISGRGVGMDVVRTNIESIGGSVDVVSTPQIGTTFVVKIPLTLAIIPALMVTSGTERYAVPQASLLELIRVSNDSIEDVGGQQVYRLRGRLLPLVKLADVFAESGTSTDVSNEIDVLDPADDLVADDDSPAAERGDASSIVVVQSDDRAFGIIVDEINDTNEIVVKPLGRFLQHAPTFAGATIMGDGCVALILDVPGFARHVGLNEIVAAFDASAGQSNLLSTATGSVRQLLVVRVGEQRLALHLDAVARLEQFTTDRLEIANHRLAVQYGSEIMPLVRLGDELGLTSDPGDPENGNELVHSIVFRAGERLVGVLVDEIIDIVDLTEEPDESAGDGASHGLSGSSIIDGRMTDLVDIQEVLQSALPHILKSGVAA